MWNALTFLLGWLVRDHASGRQPSSASVRFEHDVLARLDVLDQRHRSERAPRQYFLAGIALGIVGNAAVALIDELSPASLARIALFGFILVLGIAYADTVLRGAGLFEAVYETFVLVLALISVIESFTELLRLAGFACPACPADQEVLVAALGYLAVAVIADVVRRLLFSSPRARTVRRDG